MSRSHVFDSNGPDMRLRGTAQQLFEKYLQLGRDATGSGDRVMAESYFQHAEHYFRILNAMNQVQQQQGGAPQQRRYQGGQDQGDGQNDGPGDNRGENQGDQPELNGHSSGQAGDHDRNRDQDRNRNQDEDQDQDQDRPQREVREQL